MPGGYLGGSPGASPNIQAIIQQYLQGGAGQGLAGLAGSPAPGEGPGLGNELDFLQQPAGPSGPPGAGGLAGAGAAGGLQGGPPGLGAPAAPPGLGAPKPPGMGALQPTDPKRQAILDFLQSAPGVLQGL
jgi:hypothetical protein